MSQRTSELSWSGWGDPALARPLAPELLALVQSALGVGDTSSRVPAIDSLSLPDPRLSDRAIEGLRTLVGSDHVHTERDARIRHARGKSTVDLLRLRAGDLTDSPDAVVFPGSHDEVLAVLDRCSAQRIAVAPYGGGTSVVGGYGVGGSDFAGTVALDLRRLDRLVALDRVSRVGQLEPGLRGPEAERLLEPHGLTLGHFPQSFEYATLGGFAAARSSGQASAGYGRFDERVVGLQVATPIGGIELGRAPKSAAGPDLRQLFLGSEGALGVITALNVELSARPHARAYVGWRFEDFQRGVSALRALAQDAQRPTVLRLSDEVETALGLSRPDAIGAGGSAGGALAIVGFEGEEQDVAERRGKIEARLLSGGAEPVEGAGETWARGRFSAPYLRDSLLDAGAIVETLETATWWSNLRDLHGAVRQALIDALTADGAQPLVMCHVSHVYRSGASLYFTVACARGEDPLRRWQRAKGAASDAILRAGATISHHHGVGADHRHWYEHELGPVGAKVMRALKRELDPAGVLNPGVLIP